VLTAPLSIFRVTTRLRLTEGTLPGDRP
jgi:hypothetical protein